MSVDIVPDKLKNSINLKIIAVIVLGVIGFHYLVNNLEDPDMYVYAFSMAIPFSASIFAFITSKKYDSTLVYYKAFITLGIALMGIFLGELTYFIYEQFLNLDPYPSIADVFFFLFYPGIIFFMIVNIRFFSSETSKLKKISLITIPLTITGSYFLLTFTEEINFDFLYGLIFVGATSIALGISIHTALIFRGGIVGASWILIVIGIILIVSGDVWYYYIELLDEYSLGHPVNIFWYSGYLIILYAMYNHRKTI
ncbi:histidine kinase [Nitrosopumilus sp.]|uniref:histidine kinase n=1 Tax=Nitrosopumilus sp. TaxID=2024843 RepID=UPI00247E9D9F|nr:histidine kinase [Nitrosopumilus sp.]MCV0409766.1 histidine kinase [Nitrosopumilus sp.]